MGRQNGKLVPFLKKYLMERSFENLKYEDEENRVFSVNLPRYMKNKYEDYEGLLKEWYKCNGKLHKYKNYSKGKSVFQAALKKSIYLMKEDKVGKRLRYRFATLEEIEENRRRLKEQSKGNTESPLSPNSSGYYSGTEDESMHLDEFLDDVLDHPETYLLDYTFDENFFHDIVPEIHENVDLSSTSNDLGQLLQPVAELTMVSVCPNVTLKKYWLCTQKIKVKSTLQLICEPQIIEDEDSGKEEGSVIIPYNVFEPGITYIMKKSFELNDMMHIFLVPNVN